MAKTLVTAVGSAIALSAGAIALGDYCWRRQTRVRLVELKSYPSQTREQEVVRFDRFQSLPAPVERYFRNVLREDQPVIASATVRQRGEFLVKDSPDEWRPFIADQFFNALRPGFVWDARIRMIRSLTWPRADVRDAYVDGRGSMHAILASLIPAVHEQGAPALNEAALQRYLAEAAWFPTALLPRPGLVWSPIDDTHALATLEDGATRVSLQFEFNAKGEIVSCYIPSRFREVNGKYEPTPWGGFFRNYVNRDGMRVPNDSEAYWRIDGVIHPYFKARNVEIHYEFSPLVEQFIRHADVQGVHEVLVHAPADLVMEIARNFDLQSAPLVHAIFWLRGKILGSSPAPRQSLGLVSGMTAIGWGKLADIPGRKLIMGAVTQPWRPDVYFTAVPPKRFASYSEPDHVKIVWTLEAEALGAALTRFRTQTRAAATDPIARKKFRSYWRRFGAGAVLIRWVLLRALRRKAERHFRNRSSKSSAAQHCS